LYLALGLTLGGLLLWNKGVPLGAPVGGLLPLHIEASLVGWVLQLVMGVAYWIFPRFGMTPAQRGREELAWLSFWLVNAGLWAAGLAGLTGVPRETAMLGRVAEGLATALMAVNIWARTRASGLSPM
jgi:cbb3-type cytochrome oxidase subunit 1